VQEEETTDLLRRRDMPWKMIAKENFLQDGEFIMDTVIFESGDTDVEMSFCVGSDDDVECIDVDRNPDTGEMAVHVYIKTDEMARMIIKTANTFLKRKEEER
jgi:hypothetical protein